MAHRSVLTPHSSFFKHLLSPCGGFAESGAAEVALEDADAEAFSWLLVYMYLGELYVPDELLRPAAILADRLLLPPDCSAALQEWLIAGVTPESVVSDLVWAERHNMAQLVLRLKAYMLRYRKAAALKGVDELVRACPELASSLLCDLVTTS